MRPTWAEVDLAALRANVAELRRAAAPAGVIAVVKADGYGHGATSVARAAVEGGAAGLAVALVEEAAVLRDAGVGGPILVLSDAPDDGVAVAAALDLDLTVSSVESATRARTAGVTRLHLKIDTGMHRTGCAPDDAPAVAVAAGAALHGVWSHLAEADDPASDATARQLERFDATCGALRAAGHHWRVTHLANSAGAIDHPAARHDLVRCGIAVYGVAPAPALADRVALRPVLSLHSRVRSVRTVAAGEAVSYGGHWRASRPTTIATIPIGYADGVPRRLGLTGAEVLVRGRRCPIRGVVTMDQTMIEVDDDVAIDDHVVLIGTQEHDAIDMWDWARRTDTIAYEIACGIGPRVPRRYLG